MLYKPTNIFPSGVVVDGQQPITISWENKGNRQYHYQVKIYNNATGTLVYDTGKIASYAPYCTIPSLTNGIEYKYQVTVWDVEDNSATSEWVVFTCRSTPSASVINLGEKVLSPSYLFQGQYSQAEGIEIRSFMFNLYDNNNRLIATSGEIFSDVIEYEFDGFKNNKTYYIELQVTSQDNLRYTTPKQEFLVEFEVPDTLLEVFVENNPDNASVKITWKPIQITGIPEGNVFFVNEKVNLLDGAVTFDENYSVKGDFTLRLWFEWPGETEILKLRSKWGETIVYTCADGVRAVKNLDTIPFYFKSNEIQPILGEDVLLVMRVERNLVGLEVVR